MDAIFVTGSVVSLLSVSFFKVNLTEGGIPSGVMLELKSIIF